MTLLRTVWLSYEQQKAEQSLMLESRAPYNHVLMARAIDR